MIISNFHPNPWSKILALVSTFEGIETKKSMLKKYIKGKVLITIIHHINLKQKFKNGRD